MIKVTKSGLSLVSLTSFSMVSSSERPSSFNSFIRSNTCSETSEYSLMSFLCPHTSPSRSAMFCMERYICAELEIVLLYELGMWIAFTSGHFRMSLKMSLLDGLKARWTISSLSFKVSISSFELTTLIFIFITVLSRFFRVCSGFLRVLFRVSLNLIQGFPGFDSDSRNFDFRNFLLMPLEFIYFSVNFDFQGYQC